MNFVLNSKVEQALNQGRPVVALESTVISHGLPYPSNLGVAQAMRDIIREEGAVPATVAVLGGKIRVGLDADGLDYLAQANSGPNPSKVRKVSRGELPLAVGLRLDGATTVSATMFIAHQVGIQVFTTGGIGGVHRGLSPSGDRIASWDMSTDLVALGNTPVTVVCAGAKAILDLSATREVLETYGVPVLGFRSSHMAAFYSQSSGLPVDLRVERPEEVAAVIQARQDLKLPSGILVTVPVPAEDEIPAVEIETWAEQTTAEAQTEGISGGALTPFMLQRLGELSDGRTTRTNISLLHNNARVAAKIAVALA